MSVDSAAVRRMARLARLAVADAAIAPLAAEMNRVLELANALAAANLDAVEPMAHPHAQTVNWREDAVTAVEHADALLALAPDARAGLYTVPKVLG
jgi:aspartyl-tRNA(Asn)/glutamyl-tRNA(Gln) amidotransferase subunit C